MNQIYPAKLTLADRVRGWFSADYAARASVARYVEAMPRTLLNSHRGAIPTRTSTGWSGQPWGPSSTRTLTPAKRREMVRRSREIDENHILGSSLLDRAVDNIIGEGMIVRAETGDKGWNKAAAELWKDYEDRMDARGLMGGGDLQRGWYRSRMRDGDIGMLLLRNGRIQTIESDYIQTPRDGGDMRTRGGNDIIDGVEIVGAGRPVGFHIAATPSSVSVHAEYTRVRAEDFIWYFANNRMDRTAVRGVPQLAQLGWLLEQVDGTVEAVTMAHRMSALFGLIQKRSNPGAAFGPLGADGNAAKQLTLEPAMIEYIRNDEDIVQIKPEHPTTSFSEFMTFLIRFAGIKLGLPLELALLDFSRTNYSSARASMEQAYRRFRIEQRTFARTVLSRVYRWRVSKWINDGDLTARDDSWAHHWYGQSWPYLDPQKEAEGSLVAVDAGQSTLTDELANRGWKFEEWIEERTAEIKALEAAGIPAIRSRFTRDEATPEQSQTPEANTDENTDTDA